MIQLTAHWHEMFHDIPARLKKARFQITLPYQLLVTPLGDNDQPLSLKKRSHVQFQHHQFGQWTKNL